MSWYDFCVRLGQCMENSICLLFGLNKTMSNQDLYDYGLFCISLMTILVGALIICGIQLLFENHKEKEQK